ncbi:MAG: DUF6152 family protein [Pseudomonadota bacterium]|nr:hypothetical protein [Gammaproteobacteria bacterium]MEE2684516.1 DUF6152 family protein [Pseudomonadota bacterium]|tara:strand:+ start:4015 stop:4380 length:366 start_codon:yes stop_codon:yes gene_type:complete
MKKFILASSISIALLTAAWAHHSHGNYEMTSYMEMEGIVEDLLWINPHTWIYLNVDNGNGENTLWALEGGSPNALVRRGWARGDVNIGDSISVRCHQLKDKSNGCLLGFVTPENGEEKEWD